MNFGSVPPLPHVMLSEFNNLRRGGSPRILTEAKIEKERRREIDYMLKSIQEFGLLGHPPTCHVVWIERYM